MVARLRTLTGCLPCRQRRKKCDEVKPTCLACARNDIACQWPTAERVDGRRLRYRKGKSKSNAKRRICTSTDRLNGFSNASSLLPSYLRQYNSLFDYRDSVLIDFCFRCFLPSQYHQAADGSPTVDLSYLFYLCLESPFLLNAVSACATIDIRRDLDADQRLGERLYMAAVSDISNGIANGSLSGREDYLLATVIWLCVFEKSRGERHEHSAIHAAALCKILLLRQPFDPRHAATAELIWERMCVESYIYHSAVTTLFDSRPDLIDDTLAVLEKFQRNVSVSPSAIDDQETAMSIQSSTIQSPLLGAPYHIFVALMQGIRLFRIGNTDSINNNMVAWSCYYHVSKAQSSLGPVFQHYEDPRRWIGKLYATAIRLLFLQLIPSHGVGWETETSYLSRYTEITRTINEVRELLITTECDIEKTWGKFFLWPLAVIGALVCEKSDIILVRSWLDRVARKSTNSSVLIIKEVLEKVIWQNCSDMLPASSPPFYPPGLSIMLDTNIMNNIAARLLA